MFTLLIGGSQAFFRIIFNHSKLRYACAMTRRVRLGLWLAVLLASNVAGWFFAPQIIANIPGRWRFYLPPSVLVAITTPLPPALPTPNLTGLPTVVRPATATPTAVFSPFPTTIPTTATAETAVSPTPTFPAPTATPDPLPNAITLDNLHIIPQKFNNCGPTNLTISLNYYGQETDQFAVAAHIRPRYEDRNVTPWEMVDYVNEQTTLRARAHSGSTPRQLKELLAAGIPVIIEKGLIHNEEEGWIGHYLTLAGYDEAAQAFLTLDTLLGPWEGPGDPLLYADLLPYWQHFNYTLLVVYLPEQETAVSHILGPADNWQHAANRAQTDIETKPSNPFAWFNRGSSLAQLAAQSNDAALWQEAAAAFDQARLLGLPPRMLWYQFQPYEAYLANGRYDDVLTLAEATLISQGGRNVEETYYYQGLALRALGQTDAATLAFKRATQLRPGYALAEQALVGIRD